MRPSKLMAAALSLTMALALMAGCTQAPASAATASQSPAGSAAPASGAPDASQADLPALSIKNAKNFGISYMADGVKLVTDSDGRELLLVPRGGQAPAGYEDAVQITTPITSAMLTSTTYVGYLDSLGDPAIYDTIVALTMPETEWTNRQVLDRFASGQITYIAQDMAGVGDIEEIVGVAPELVFADSGMETDVPLLAMLDEVEIDYAVATEWVETDSAASLEWIKFFAAFYNLDEEADAIYEAKLARRAELYALAEGIPEAEKPVVAYGMVFDGVVYTQAGGSTLARELEKAGAIYALADVEGDGSIQLGMEEFLDKCKDADIMIYTSLPQYCPDKQALLDTEPLFAEFAAFQGDQVYVYDMGYYMNSAKVVEKLEDNLAMFHPGLMENHTFTFYQKLPDAA